MKENTLPVEKSDLAKLAERLDPTDLQEGYRQAFSSVIGFTMGNLISARPQAVDRFLDDPRLEDPKENVQYYSERVVQGLNTVFREPMAYDTLLYVLTRPLSGNFTGPNMSLCIGQTLFHLCATYKHYGLMQHLVKRLVERDGEHPAEDRLLKQMFGLKNQYEQTVYSLVDMADLSKNQKYQALYQFVDQNKQDFPASTAFKNDQQETTSCRFVAPNEDSRVFVSQLHQAAETQRAGDLTAYLSEGMDPNVRIRTDNVFDPANQRASTPLHYWVESTQDHADETVLTTLLRFGADIDALNAFGLTALQGALESYGRSNQCFIPLLIQHGAHLRNGRDLVNLLRFQRDTNTPITLPLTQLDVVDKTAFTEGDRSSQTIAKAFVAIIEAKKQAGDRAIALDIAQVLKRAETDDSNVLDRLYQTAVQFAVEGERLSDDVVDGDAQNALDVDRKKQAAAAIVIDLPEPLSIENVRNDEMKKSFESHDYARFLQHEIFAKIQCEGASNRYDLTTKKAIQSALDDLSHIVSTTLEQAKTPAVTDALLADMNRRLIESIENDILKRDAIRYQNGLVALLKGAIGILLALWTVGAPLFTQDRRERFTAKFFKSSACYQLTLVKQALAHTDTLQDERQSTAVPVTN